jgi:hypothetical protein
MGDMKVLANMQLLHMKVLANIMKVLANMMLPGPNLYKLLNTTTPKLKCRVDL